MGIIRGLVMLSKILSIDFNPIPYLWDKHLNWDLFISRNLRKSRVSLCDLNLNTPWLFFSPQILSLLLFLQGAYFSHYIPLHLSLVQRLHFPGSSETKLEEKKGFSSFAVMKQDIICLSGAQRRKGLLPHIKDLRKISSTVVQVIHYSLSLICKSLQLLMNDQATWD